MPLGQCMLTPASLWSHLVSKHLLSQKFVLAGSKARPSVGVCSEEGLLKGHRPAQLPQPVREQYLLGCSTHLCSCSKCD